MPIDHERRTTISSPFRDARDTRAPRGPEDSQTLLIDVRRLKSCRYQRRVVTPEKVRPLAETIRQNGLLQNVTARPLSGDPEHDYELIAGHRRTAAFRLLFEEATTPEEREKWSRIPCTLKLGLSEVQVASLAAIENLERDDGDVLDQARSLLEVKRAGDFTTNVQVAEATGMNIQRVTRLLRLAEAPEVMQKAVAPGVYLEVTDREGHTRTLHVKLDLTVVLAVGPYYSHQEINVGRPEAIAKTERLLQRIARSNWPRARVDAEVKKLLGANRSTGTEDDERDGSMDELGASLEASPAVRSHLFRDKSNQFIIYPKNIEGAGPEERKALAARLKAYLALLESGASPSSQPGVKAATDSLP